MRCAYACNSPDHVLSRRQFMGAMAATGVGAGFSSFTRPAVAAELARKQRQVLVIWLAGGASQLETWDPKPKTETGGPFRSIETSVPGVRISELLPRTAMQMHRLALLRSINTNENDHGKGTYLMHTGRPQSPATLYPHLGSVMARWLTEAGNPLPGYIHITPGGGGKGSSEAAFLGPKYNPLYLGAVSNPAVLVLDWKTGAVKTLQHPKEDIKGVAWGVRFHPDGFIVAASGGTSGGFLWFTKPDQESEFFKFPLPNTARDLDLHPDGIQIATAHHDGIVRISAMKAKA